MKYIFIILSLILCYSCANRNISLCFPNFHPDSIKTQMIPISVGNKWYYEDKSKISASKNVILEVTELDTLFIKKDGNTIPVMGYSLSVKDSIDKNEFNLYFIKCPEKLLLVNAEKSNPKIIIANLTDIDEYPASFAVNKTNPNTYWIGSETIATDFGRLNCYVQYSKSSSIGPALTPFSRNYYINDMNDLISEEKVYYYKGIGIVRVEQRNRLGKVLISRELKKYEIKK